MADGLRDARLRTGQVIPDLAVSRGEEAYRQAKVLGDRWFEFLSAGGTAMAMLDLDDVEGAHTWLTRAEAAAAEAWRFQGALVKERGVRFWIVIVKRTLN